VFVLAKVKFQIIENLILIIENQNFASKCQERKTSIEENYAVNYAVLRNVMHDDYINFYYLNSKVLQFQL
jgi:hypothetical protein